MLTSVLVKLLLQHLESKAEQRNPDEFYFAMENAKTKDGVHIRRCVQHKVQLPQGHTFS